MAPGAKSKFGAPMIEPEVFQKQMYCTEKCICDFVGTFRRPTQSFSAPILIRPLAPLTHWYFNGMCNENFCRQLKQSNYY